MYTHTLTHSHTASQGGNSAGAASSKKVAKKAPDKGEAGACKCGGACQRGCPCKNASPPVECTPRCHPRSTKCTNCEGAGVGPKAAAADAAAATVEGGRRRALPPGIAWTRGSPLVEKSALAAQSLAIVLSVEATGGLTNEDEVVECCTYTLLLTRPPEGPLLL